MANRGLLVILMLALLTSCATSYQPLGLSGGYSDLQLNATTYKVAYNGNGYTSTDRLQNLLLYRCANLAMQNNFRYFIIVDGNTSYNESSYTTPAQVNSTSYGSTNGYGTANTNYYGNYASTNLNYNSNTMVNTRTTYTPAQTTTFRKYQMVAIMQVVPDNHQYPHAFDALLIIRNLKDKV